MLWSKKHLLNFWNAASKQCTFWQKTNFKPNQRLTDGVSEELYEQIFSMGLRSGHNVFLEPSFLLHFVGEDVHVLISIHYPYNFS